MAYKLEVGIPGDDGRISIMHTFYGETRAACLKLRDAHADICPNFGPAVKSDETTEEFTEIDDSEWPSVEDIDGHDDSDDDDSDDEDEED